MMSFYLFRTVLKQAEQQAKSGSSVPVISDIFSNAPFTGGMGAGSGPMPSLPQQPLPPNQLTNTGEKILMNLMYL